MKPIEVVYCISANHPTYAEAHYFSLMCMRTLIIRQVLNHSMLFKNKNQHVLKFSLYNNEPSGVTVNAASLREFMPVLTSEETCLTYSAPACRYIALRCEYVLLSFLLGTIRSLLTDTSNKYTLQSRTHLYID